MLDSLAWTKLITKNYVFCTFRTRCNKEQNLNITSLNEKYYFFVIVSFIVLRIRSFAQATYIFVLVQDLVWLQRLFDVFLLYHKGIIKMKLFTKIKIWTVFTIRSASVCNWMKIPSHLFDTWSYKNGTFLYALPGKELILTLLTRYNARKISCLSNLISV